METAVLNEENFYDQPKICSVSKCLIEFTCLKTVLFNDQSKICLSEKCSSEKCRGTIFSGTASAFNALWMLKSKTLSEDFFQSPHLYPRSQMVWPGLFFVNNFYPATIYRGIIREREMTYLSCDLNPLQSRCNRLGPLKDALPTELQRNGILS